MGSFNSVNIRYENVKAIFQAIAGSGEISRAEIASAADVSLVTAGKTADALLDVGILKQQKEIRATAGRRAGRLTINTDKFALVLDLSDKRFVFSVTDLALQTVESFTHTYRTEQLYEDNLRDFLSSAADHIYTKYDLTDCFGFGISLPGVYHEADDCITDARIPELNHIRIGALLAEQFPMLPVYAEENTKLSALSNVSVIPDYLHKNVLYWFVGKADSAGAFLMHGNFLDASPGRACDFGQIVLPAGNTVGTALQRCRKPEEFAAVLAMPVHSCLQILAPHVIMLEFETLDNCVSVVPELCRILHEKYHHRYDRMPDILALHYENRQSHRGLVMQMRSRWLERIIFDKETM
ncbi:MAG: ROK family transcriptional regulator [Ruminococcaceae bacterium]|nr:ROK family transcriptional regulator [Oscillospiraceae bacterium]